MFFFQAQTQKKMGNKEREREGVFYLGGEEGGIEREKKKGKKEKKKKTN